MAGEGNTVIQSGVAESITLVNNNQTCWLTSVLYLFKIIGINLKLETGKLQMFGKNDTITAVKNTLRKMFEDKVFYEIRNSSKLGLYNCIKETFTTERYLSEISYYKYRSAFAKFRISAHTFPIEKGRWSFIPSSKRYCPLCLGNHIGDEKHYILHCTDITSSSPEKVS